MIGNVGDMNNDEHDKIIATRYDCDDADDHAYDDDEVILGPDW